MKNCGDDCMNQNFKVAKAQIEKLFINLGQQIN